MKRLILWTSVALFASSVFADSLYIRNAQVHTVSERGVLNNANVLIKNGKIAAVGSEALAEKDSVIIEGNGRPLTPGFMNAATQIGSVEIDAIDDTVDSTSDDPAITASFRISDIINPDATTLPFNLSMGLTRAIVVPGISTSVFGGQAVLINLRGEVLKDGVAQVAEFEFTNKKNNGGSRAAMLQKFRTLFDDAKDYAANKASFQRGERREYAASFRDLEALNHVLSGKQCLFVASHRALDMRVLLKLQKEYGIKLVIVGATEAHLIAKELAAANVPVVIDVLNNTPNSFDQLAATFENAARLVNAGVSVAFRDSTSGHNAYWVRQNAGNAVAHGMPYDAAIASLTRVPSQLAGTAHTFGKIAKGMDADVVLWDGDPLDVTTFPTHVIINGIVQDLTSRSSRLRDRYKSEPQAPARAYSR